MLGMGWAIGLGKRMAPGSDGPPSSPDSTQSSARTPRRCLHWSPARTRLAHAAMSAARPVTVDAEPDVIPYANGYLVDGRIWWNARFLHQALAECAGVQSKLHKWLGQLRKWARSQHIGHDVVLQGGLGFGSGRPSGLPTVILRAVSR